MTYHKFTSRADGMSRAQRFHACLDCRYHSPKTWKICPSCGGKNRQYFMSKTEFQRGMTLLLLRDAGTIQNLTFQTKHELRVNGYLVDYYRPDAEYDQNGVHIIEDTKPESFMDKYAKIKIQLFEAVYGVNVTIPQRKSGNIT